MPIGSRRSRSAKAGTVRMSSIRLGFPTLKNSGHGHVSAIGSQRSRPANRGSVLRHEVAILEGVGETNHVSGAVATPDAAAVRAELRRDDAQDVADQPLGGRLRGQGIQRTLERVHLAARDLLRCAQPLFALLAVGNVHDGSEHALTAGPPRSINAAARIQPVHAAIRPDHAEFCGPVLRRGQWRCENWLSTRRDRRDAGARMKTEMPQSASGMGLADSRSTGHGAASAARYR